MSVIRGKKEKEQDLEAYLYTSDKARLIAMVQEMASRAGKSLNMSVEALAKLDLNLAQDVIDEDDFIDEMEEQIDQECLYSIAMRQPMREDLRFVYAVMKIITDIERIGDQAVNIALRLRKLVEIGGGRPCPALKLINDMARETSVMLNEAMEGFIKEDEKIVFSARVHRKKIHKTRDEAMEELMNIPASDSAADINTGMLFVAMWIVRHISRISDHVLNLAEKIYFIATGISPMTLKKQIQRKKLNAGEENEAE